MMPGIIKEYNTERFSLDKRVNVALLVVLSVQLIGAVWSFATLAAKVDTNTSNINRVEVSFDARAERLDQASRERNRQVMLLLNRIDQRLDNMADK